MMISREIKKSVLIPIVFFSWFKFPLSLKELRRYLWQAELSEADIAAYLKELPHVRCEGGWVWRGELWGGRATQVNLSAQLWRKVHRWRWLFSQVPFISEVCVSNTLAYDNATSNSDIDLLIVAQTGRIWIARAYLILLLNLFKLRVRSTAKFGKFSPEFFVSEKALNIQSLALTKDYYLSYWLADLVPIWPDGEHHKFRQSNNWVAGQLPIAWRSPKLRKCRYSKPSFFRWLIEKILAGKLGDKLETEAYYRQKKIIDKNILRLGINPSVITTRDIIKLHFNDRRAEVSENIEQALNDLASKTK